MNTLPSWDQVSGIADRVILVLLTYAVSRGWLTSADVAPLASVAIGLGGVIWGAYVNRKASILASAAAIPEVKKIQLDQTAAATALNQATPAKVTQS